MILNLTTENFKNILNVFFYCSSFLKELKGKYQLEYQEKLGDWDLFTSEILQVYMLKHMINAHFKFNSPHKQKRSEAMKSLKLLARSSL
jgi:hypothetical protein